ncbi:hypothetical protein Dimus_007614 [Dionaea muscipula]
MADGGAELVVAEDGDGGAAHHRWRWRRALDVCEATKENRGVAFVASSAAKSPLNAVSMLSGTNFKDWKEAIEIVIGCMDLDQVLQEDRLVSTEDND